MNAETQTFIRDLFVRCPTESPVTFLTLTAIHPDGDRFTPSRHVPLGNQTALEHAMQHLMEANERGWGAYLGIATRQRDFRRWSRGGKHELALLPALFADIDEPNGGLWRLTWFDLPPSYILHSGHGYHAYWLLDTPTTDFVTADRAIHGLAQHLGGDEALTVAQSMRLPGTVNTKPGREGIRCAIISHDPNCLYSLDDFQPFMPVVEHQEPHGMRTRQYEIIHGDRQHLIDDVTDAVLNQLDGHWRSNGFIAARCPLPHCKDRPGKHFSYSPATGWGFCFGKHGKIPLAELARLLGFSEHSLQINHAA